MALVYNKDNLICFEKGSINFGKMQLFKNQYEAKFTYYKISHIIIDFIHIPLVNMIKIALIKYNKKILKL